MGHDIDQFISDVLEENGPVEQAPAPATTDALPEVVRPSGPQPMFEDHELLGLCAEILTNMRSDRKQLDTLISNFVEMVFNEGDSTTASKEALVSLVANKTNMSDKQMKIVELMAKFKLKEMADAPKSVTVSQENYHFGGTRRSFLEQIEKRMQKKKTKEKNG